MSSCYSLIVSFSVNARPHSLSFHARATRAVAASDGRSGEESDSEDSSTGNEHDTVAAVNTVLKIWERKKVKRYVTGCACDVARLKVEIV